MDIGTISSISSAQTKLMLANVKTKATEQAQSENTPSTSKGISPSSSATNTNAMPSTADTSTSSTDSGTSDAAKIAALEAKLEGGQNLTLEEIQFLKKASPGTYDEIVKQRSESSDYQKALSSAASVSDAFTVHINKLSDLLTETKAIANDSSLTDEKRVAMFQSVTARLNTVENITSQLGTGRTDTSAAVFRDLLSASSDASQQRVMLKNDPSLASQSAESSSNSTDPSSTSSANDSATGPSHSKNISASKTASASNSATSSADESSAVTKTDSTTKDESSKKAKTASEMTAKIRSIISTETSSAFMQGVKTAGLNLLV